jgi:tetratricopeptide (TPR) repeat protein
MSDVLQEGRHSVERRQWNAAFEALASADTSRSLGIDDLMWLAWAAYLTARQDDFVRAMERAHHSCRDAGDMQRAARCAIWLAMGFFLHGEFAPAMGWHGRAARLIEGLGVECAEQGYLLLPLAYGHAEEGDYEAWHIASAEIVQIGQRFGDGDLVALGLNLQGRSLVSGGRVVAGLALLDEAMVAVVTDQLSPWVTGLVYCSVIEACQEVYAVRRSQEWTAALKRWCDDQPGLVPYAGQCLVHRAELMRLHGAWVEALDETKSAMERLAREGSPPIAARAHCLEGDLHRLVGALEQAEAAYDAARQLGGDPQPGIALLRMAQRDRDGAAGLIRRAVAERTDPLERASVLPAYVEIMVAVGDGPAAERGCAELTEITTNYTSGVLGAMAATANARLAISRGEAELALPSLRSARRVWQELDAPYELARVQVLFAQACRALGDNESAELELEAAREVFHQLGAVTDLRGLDAIREHPEAETFVGATPRVGVMRREGHFWMIGFHDDARPVRHSRGLEHLARLLAEPQHEVAALELASQPGGAVAMADAGPLLDAQARNDYKLRLRELEEEVEEARAWVDTERTARAELEIEALMAELSRAVWRGGRVRVAGSVAERARISVTKSIKAAISRIGDVDQALARHLSVSVRTGYFCAYCPEPRAAVEWQISSDASR